MLFLLSFSFLLCRNESSAWSVSGHRIIWSHSSLFLVFYFIRPCANVPNTVTRWLHPTWFLPVVTPENQKCWERKPRLGRGRCRGVQTSGWFWGWRGLCAILRIFLCLLIFLVTWNSVETLWFLSGKAFTVRWIMIFMCLNLGICLMHYLNTGK